MSGSILLLSLLLAAASAQEEEEQEQAEEDEQKREAEAPGTLHAPPPVEESAAPPPPPAGPPPAGPPEGWKSHGPAVKEPSPRPPAPNWQGTYAQVGVMGGQAVGGGVVFVSPGGVAFDLSAGPRIGFGSELYANLFGMVGLSWTGGDRSRHGLFARGGGALPLDHWFEALAAGGYTFRFHTGHGNWTGADIGAGVMVVQDLPDRFQPWPGILYLRWAMEFSTTEAQRGG